MFPRGNRPVAPTMNHNNAMNMVRRNYLLNFFEKRKPHFLPLFHVSFGAGTSQVADPADVPDPFSDTDGFTRVEKIKGMRTLQTIIIGRKDKPPFAYARRFLLVHAKS